MVLQISNTRIEDFCSKHPYFSAEQILLQCIDTIERCCSDDNSISMMEGMFSQFTNALNGMEEMFERKVSHAMKDLTLEMTHQIKNSNENITNAISMCSDVQEKRMKEDLCIELTKMKSEIPSLDLNVEEILHRANTENMSMIIEQMKCVSNPIMLGRLNDIHDSAVKSSEVLETMRVDLVRGRIVEQKVENIDVNLTKYLDRMKNPSSRGVKTETQFKILLESAFPTHEVNHVNSSDQKGRMDLNLVKENKPTILIDSKDYTGTVPKTEVEKFERDILLSKNHGIMIAPFGGISNKNHFEICKIGNRFGIFLTKTGMETKEIENAVEILYDLDKMLSKDDDVKEGLLLTEEMIDRLNSIITSNISKMKGLKDHLNLAIQQCDVSMFDSIKQILRLTSTNEDKKEHKCDICKRVFPSPQSLGGHRRSCR